MRLLLDSHIMLWWSGAVPSRLSDQTRVAINAADEVFVSAATVWELEIKLKAGKLYLERPDWAFLDQQSVATIAIERGDAIVAARLPLIHRDPFDRMIVAQAMRRDLTLVTADRALAGYGITLLPA